jgi:glycosyltransferase 2 family protein
VTLLNLCLAAWWIGLSLALPLSFADYLVTVVTLLPLSVGGWGLREGAVVALFGFVGVPSHSALAFSVLFGFAGIAASLPALAFVWYDPDREKATEYSADLLDFAIATGVVRDR